MEEGVWLVAGVGQGRPSRIPPVTRGEDGARDQLRPAQDKGG